MQRTVITRVVPYANIQQVLDLPANTRRVRVTSISNTSFRFSFIAGQVEISKGYYVAPEESRDTGYLQSVPAKVYYTSNIPGNQLSFEIYTGNASRILNTTQPSQKPNSAEAL